MINPIFLLRIFVFHSFMTNGRVNGDEFGAVTDSLQEYLCKFYLQEWNGDPPSALDLATMSASTRVEICQDIIGSGVFAVYAKYRPVDFAEAYTELMRQPSNDDSVLRHPSVRRTASEAYGNLYHRQQIPVAVSLPHNHTEEPVLEMKKEYTFPCLLEEKIYDDDDDDEDDGDESESEEEGTKSTRIIAVYVSKVYKMHQGLHARRFVFHEIDGMVDVMLAERSAEVYTRPDFNIELHYLELRKHREFASRCNTDPVCNLTLDRSGQVLRLCEIVLSSSHFRKRFGYPQRLHMGSLVWSREKISFRTTDGRMVAEKGEYFERMLPCFANSKHNGSHQMIYISRAYNAYQVFVYFQERHERKFYLENLFINVSIVHEPHRLRDVEI